MFQARVKMIEGQLAPNQVLDERVIAAMGITPRERFVPKAYSQAAYVDAPIPLSPHRAMLSPMVLGWLLQAANIQEHQRVLVIAGSTGYSAAIAAMMGASVVLLEENKAWADQAAALFKELAIHQATVVQGAMDGSIPHHHTFDAILIEGAVETLPDWLADCLTPDGCVLTVMRNAASSPELSAMGKAVVARRQSKDWHLSEIGAASMPLLPAFAVKRGFTL